MTDVGKVQNISAVGVLEKGGIQKLQDSSALVSTTWCLAGNIKGVQRLNKMCTFVTQYNFLCI